MSGLTPIEVARLIFGVECALALAFSCLVVASGALSRWRLRRYEDRMTMGRQLLGSALAAQRHDADGIAGLRHLPWSVQCDLFLEFGAALTGRGRVRLMLIGLQLGLTARAESLCTSRFWWRRLSGARVITALNHDCPAAHALLRDPNPLVRAQILAWAAGRVDQEVIGELVEHLVDAEQICRFVVQDSLLRLGRPATSAVGRFLATHEGPELAEALAVARGLAEPELLEPVIRLGNHPLEDVRARVGGVLAMLGGHRAVAMLEKHLEDPSLRVRAAAARALGELGQWQSSSELVRLLGDTAWPVRREAALSLRRMGGVGLLALRRALGHPNPFAADMARQVLDLPEAVYRRIAV